ncbi:MAG: PIG-L family deacetylase [Rariglobus sp.]
MNLPRLFHTLFLFGAVFISATAWSQRPQFKVRSDYAYDLAATRATTVAVELNKDGFVWPQGLSSEETLFLEVSLDSGRADKPALELSANGITVRQVFEAGGAGRRFFDVSPLRALAPGTKVSLAGSGATWSTGAARVFAYRNPSLRDQRVLVIAPHPDDAEIAAFGIYRQSGSQVVTVTAGDAGGENFETLFPENGEHYRIKGWIRTWDSISVPFYGGVMPGAARNLGYYDATLRKMQQAPTTPAGPLYAALDDPAYFRRLNVDRALRDRKFAGTWQGLVKDLVWELRRVRPTIIVAPHPLLDAHADHQYTTIALIEALEQWKGRCELYLYTNHAMENEAFPLGERHAMTGLPPWSAGDLFFQRLYSHPLSVEEQKLKLVALEDMHDLRAFDMRDGTPPVDAETRNSWRDYDYYRRGPRPNELFFVLSREDAKRMREAFLAQQAARR